LIDRCLTPTLEVFQLYHGLNNFLHKKTHCII